MKRFILFFSLLSLVGCTTLSIPEGFDGDLLTSHSTDIISLVNDRSYESVVEQFREDLKPMITLEELSLNLENKLVSVGAYTSMKSLYLMKLKIPLRMKPMPW